MATDSDNIRATELGVICIFLGLFFTIIGSVLMHSNTPKSGRLTLVTGEIIGFMECDSNYNDITTCDDKFKYTINGKTYRGYIGDSSSNIWRRPGETISLVVSRNKPDEYVLVSLLIVYFLCIFLGVITISIGVCAMHN